MSLINIAVCQLLGLFLNYGCFFNLKSVLMTVAFLVYVFLARIRFPRNESITSIVRERYSGEKGGL